MTIYRKFKIDLVFLKVFAKPILKVQRDALLIKEGEAIFIVCYWTQNGHETSFPLIRLAPYTVNGEKAEITLPNLKHIYYNSLLKPYISYWFCSVFC